MLADEGEENQTGHRVLPTGIECSEPYIQRSTATIMPVIS